MLKQNVVAQEYLLPESRSIKPRKAAKDKSKATKDLISFLEESVEKEDRKESREKGGVEKEKYKEDNRHSFDLAVKKAEEKVRAVEDYELELALMKHRNKNKKLQAMKPPPVEHKSEEI